MQGVGPSLLVVETGVTVIAVGLALCWPRVGSKLFVKLERFFRQLARRRGLSILAVGSTALLLRLSILPFAPIPQPFIHDEFSFLLAGDTFASGRVTNPTPLFWEHFESFHITQKPSYMSMYFPAQGLILAAGKIFAGNPWYGVCVSAALMCGALCWMLQAWVPPNWALLGGMLAVLRLGLFSYWVNSYYGGAASAIGGALVLGALPRIMRNARIRDGVLLTLGAAILANSRAYEGLVLCLPVALILVWWLAVKEHPPTAVLVRRMAAPAAILVVTAALIGYYDYRVFGKVTTLSYQVNRATYASAPVFIWQLPRAEPVYRHKVMREFYSKWEMGDFQYARTLTGFFARIAQKLGIVIFFFFGTALFVPLVMLPWVLRDRRVRYLIVVGGVFALGLSVNAWLFPHYLAPIAGGVYVILLQAMRHLRVWRPQDQPFGLALVRVIPMVCLLLAGIRLCADPLGLTTNRWPSMWYGTAPLGLPRARVAAELERYPGRQLAIVRYSANHSVFDDWVYNAADIERSKVIWSREMGGQNDLDLLRHFHDRNIWLVEPDAVPPRISPYTAMAVAPPDRSSHDPVVMRHSKRDSGLQDP